MSEKKSSSSVWWPKRVFNWSNTSAEAKSSTVKNDSKETTSDNLSVVSSESQDILNSNNKYVTVLVKQIRKRLKMSGDECNDRLTPWMSDSNAKQCYDCSEKFTTIRRRHHCRICGQIFCTKCCDQQIESKILGLSVRGYVRSCNYCHKIVNQCIIERTLQDSNSALRDSEFIQFREILLSKSLTDNSLLQANDTSVTIKSGEQMSSSFLGPHSFHSLRRKGSIGFREEEYANLRTRLLEVDRDVTLPGTSPSPLHSFSSFGSYKTVIKSIEGSDDEVMPLRSEESTHEPLWVKEINDDSDSLSFDKIDSLSELLFDSTESDGKQPLLRDTKQSSKRMAYSTSTYDIELDFEKDRVSISKANKKDSTDDKSSVNKSGLKEVKPTDGLSIDFEGTTTSFNWESLKEGTQEKLVYDSLNASYSKLYNKLLTQLLEEEGLSSSWLNVIQKISGKVSSVVRPNSHNDFEEMDVRNYVKIKTIPNGVKNDCQIINGVVISKNVVNRKMNQTLIHPRILLLSCPIVYQRYEKKLTLLDNVLLQENQYINNLVAKICSYEPDLILVEKTVSRIAREMLLENGITLVCNVKSVVIDRISRFTGAAIVSSLDAQIGIPILGICQKFHLETFNQKTYMYFDGCPQHLGCTVLLRGGPLEELKKIKWICSFMVFSDFNWQLERSFLMDEYCFPPELVDNKSNETSITIDSNLRDSPPKARNVSSILVDDNSDPLRSMASNLSSKDILSPINCSQPEDIKEDTFSQMTSKLSYFLSKLQLSCSPFIAIPLPHLMTNSGNNSKMRKYFDSNIIWSKRFETNCSKSDELLKVENTIRNREHSSPNEMIIHRKHPLLTRNIKLSAKSQEVKSLIADFRANGPFWSSSQNNLNESKSKSTSMETSDEQESEESELKVDVLNPRYHQQLAVLFSSFSYASTNAPNYCVKPWIINMDFYGSNDIPLGGFLERYCFRPSYTCPSNSCSTPMIEHVRRFVHSNGCILIVLRQLQQKVEAAHDSIITWSWCQKCKTGTPYSPLSQDSWLLSFAKYLELKFYGFQYKRRATPSSVACMDHSLHMDHFQFFAYKQVVASFKFMLIQIHDITLPPTLLAIHCNTFSKSVFIEDLKQIAIKGYEIYSLILEKLCSIRDETNGTKYEIIVDEFKDIEAKERAIFRQKIEEIQLTLTSYSGEVVDETIVYKLEDTLIQLKQLIAESIINWNQKIQDFVTNKKKDEKLSAKSGNQTIVSNSHPKSPPVSIVQNEESNIGNGSNFEELIVNSRTVSVSSATSLVSFCSEVKTEANPTEVLKACIEEQEKECDETIKALNNIIDESNDQKRDSTRVSTTLSVSSYGYDVDIGINDCLENAIDFEAKSDNYAVYNIHDSTDETKKQEDNQSLLSLTNVTIGSNETKSLANSSQSSIQRVDSVPNTVRKIFKELLTNANNLTITNPFPLSEHYVLPTHRDDIAFIVKDDDPGSIISYALTSSEYERQMNEVLRHSSSPFIKRKQTVSTETETTIESSINSKVSSNPMSQHFDLQYNDSTTKFYCCVYFAEQFRRFRAHIFGCPDGEELYIRSLTNCIPWKARGGKSGSTFCKTLNDRFILKEMSKPELISFLNIANCYFDYCTRAIDESRPSLLARIVGIYRTSYKNTATNNASKLYLLVMENLFYKCNITQKFDLKGSMRNRLVNTSSPNLKADQIVLLDENLMQMTCDCPLYVHSHSKAILRAAIANDSLFLCSNSVMDYSLLVGIDDQTNEFVVGIIDYIRPFTWDKKLESVVKSVGSQGKLPTIVEPELYRMRFCEAMDQYFLCVPDKWHSIVNYI